jgi:3-oxoadipate enol-lactonase
METEGGGSSPLYVRDCGTGRPLVLLHGVLVTGDVFDQLAPRLAGHCRLLVPDQRGHGRSASLTGPLVAEALAADLVPTLDALGVRSAHVLGHSQGGATALAFARAHPERVRSLILVSTFVIQRLTWWERLAGSLAPPVVRALGTARIANLIRRTRTASGGRRLTPEAAEVLAATVAANDTDRMAEALQAIRPFDSRGWLEELRVPTRVIAGDQDRMVSPRQARRLASGIRGARLDYIPDAGHELPLSHPDELAHLIVEWLDEVDPEEALAVENDASASAELARRP